MRRLALVLGLGLLLLSGCISPRVLEVPVEIQFACARCLGAQPVGYAPLFVSFVFPHEAQWDFGDGATATGTFVSHAFERPGLYKVQAVALSQEGRGLKAKSIRFVGTLWIKVLQVRESSYETNVPHKFVDFVVVAPKQLALGEKAQLCFYATARANLDVLYVRLYESYELIGEGEFEFMRIRVPAGAMLEHCVVLRGFRTGGGYVDVQLFAALGPEGARSEARIVLEISTP